MNRKNGVFDLYSVDTSGMRISNADTAKFMNKIVNDARFRSKIEKVERITGKQLTVTALLYGRNDGGNNVPGEKEREMQERVIAERKRMVTG